MGSKGYNISIILSIILLSGTIFGSPNSVFAPSEVVDQSNSMSPSGAVNIGSDVGFILGQQFVPTASDISSVDIGFRDNTAVDDTTNVKVTIWQSATAAFTSGTLVGSVTQLVNEGPSYDDDLGTTVHEQTINFQFASPLTLTPGLTYVIQVEEADAAPGSTDLSWTAGTAYSGGFAIKDGAPDPSFNDYTFATYTLVSVPPTIDTDPTNQVELAGDTATFTVAASGDPTLSYDWRKGGISLGAADSPTLTLLAVTDADEGSYDVVVSNGFGTDAISAAATLTVNTPASVGTPPTNTAVLAGSTAIFMVMANGDPTITYQWQYDDGLGGGFVDLSNGGDISNADDFNLMIDNTVDADEGDYRVVVSNGFGSPATSASASLTVNTPASITNPIDNIAGAINADDDNPDEDVTFTVEAEGDTSAGAPAITYSWTHNAVPLSETSNELDLGTVEESDEGTYEVTVSNGFGLPITSSATLTVTPDITTAPTTIDPAQNEDDTNPTDVEFTVAGAGDGTLTYAWEKDNVIIGGETGTTLDLDGVGEIDEGTYTARVTDDDGTTESSADLTVTPDITTAPVNQTVEHLDNTSFSTTAAGDGTLIYQWRDSSGNVAEAGDFSGTQTDTLSIATAVNADEENYDVQVTDDDGTTTTPTAELIVRPTFTAQTGDQPTSTTTENQDRIRLTFTEDVAGVTTGFSLTGSGGPTIDAVIVVNAFTYDLDLSGDLNSGITPTVNYVEASGTVVEASANATPMTDKNIVSTDGLPPEFILTTNEASLTTAGTIADLDVQGGFIFTVTATSEEEMNTAVIPVATFSGGTPVTDTLALSTVTPSSWDVTPDGTVYTFRYDLTDVGVDVEDIDVTVTGGQDNAPSNNNQVTDAILSDGDATKKFDIDTFNPFIPTGASLTIVSTNQFAPLGNTDFAKDGDTAIITLSANEKLDPPADGDATVNGITSTSGGKVSAGLQTLPTPNDTVMIITYTVSAVDEDTEGALTFDIDYRDEFFNVGGPPQATGPGVPRTVTESNVIQSDTTNNSDVVVDYTAPGEGASPSERVVIIQTSNGDPSADPQYTYERVNQNIDQICNDANDVIAVSGCYQTKIAGDIEGTQDFELFETPGDFMHTEVRTFLQERQTEDITVDFKDRAGNTAQTADSINLDAIITSFTLTDPAPTSNSKGEWEDVVFKVKGVIENPQVLLGTSADKVLVDWKYRLNFGSTFDFPAGVDDDGDGLVDEDEINGIDDDADTFVDEDPSGYVHPTPAQCVDLTLDPDATNNNGDRYLFEATTEYPRPSQDLNNNAGHTHVPEAILVLGGCTEGFDFTSTSFMPVPDTETTSTNVDKASADTQETLERDTTVNLNVIPDTFIKNRFYLTGGESSNKILDTNAKSGIVEDVDGKGVPGLLIEFEGILGENDGTDGDGTNLPDATSIAGLTIQDNDGMDVDADGIMRLKPSTDGTGAGATILTPYLPGFVSITIEDSGDKNYDLLIIDGIGDELITNVVSESSGPIGATFSDEDGIASVELLEMFDETDPPVVPPVTLTGATMGISSIDTFGLELEKINSIDFKDADVVSKTFNKITFDHGLFFSEGDARNTKKTMLSVDAFYRDIPDNIDYLASRLSEDTNSNEKFYTTKPSSLSGYTSTGDATVKQDSGTGVYVKKCEYDAGDSNGNGIIDDDVDRDGICDTWEQGTIDGNGNTGGIPFSFGGGVLDYLLIDAPCLTCVGDTSITTTAAGNPVNLLDAEKIYAGIENANDLTPTLNMRDVYLEIDSMDDHPVDIRALNDVITLWADLSGPPAEPLDALPGVDYSNVADGVALHIFLDKGRIQASFIDSGTVNGQFDSGEPLYEDRDSSNSVSKDDVRLLNTIDDYTIVEEGDADIPNNLIAIGVVPNDGITHNPITRVWKDNNFLFGDDFNTIKASFFGTRDETSHHISTNPTHKLEVVDSTLGHYKILIDNLLISTPFDPDTFPQDKEKGWIQTKVLFKTSSQDFIDIGYPGNEDISVGLTDDTAGLKTHTPSIKSFVGAPGGVKKIHVNLHYTAFNKQTSKLMDTIEIPFTLHNPDHAPLGCNGASDASPSPAGTLCDNPTRPGGFPLMSGRHLDAFANVWRYMENVHSFGGPSGEAELRGNDMIMALGDGFGVAFNGHPGGTRHQQAGTMAHELLHLANFLHGGPDYLMNDPTRLQQADSAINCKPYPGVDKYSRQLPNIYLDLALSDPSNPHSDVLSTSEWQLEYSDGSHGSNPRDFLFDAAHISAIGGTLGGLDETSLNENNVIPGTPYTMVWATPASSHSSPHAYHKHISTATGPVGTGIDEVFQAGAIDWDDSHSIETVSADITDFGISGCAEGVDAAFYDYDTGYHIDLNYKRTPSGQFDGITSFVNDATGNDLWRSIAQTAIFEGLDPEEVQTGEEVVVAGTVHQIIIQLLATPENDDTEADPLHLEDVAKAQVWVSKDPDATLEGSDPLTTWVQIFDANPSNLGSEFMRWVEDDGQGLKESLVIDWDTPNLFSDIGPLPDNDSINGDWFIRVVLSDNPLGAAGTEEGTPIVCDANVVEQLPGGVKDPLGCFKSGAGLFGEEGEPNSNFLQDLTDDCLDGDMCGPLEAGDHLKATGKVILKLPRPMKVEEFVPEMLQDLIPLANDQKTVHELNKAIDRVNDSINPALWVDTVTLITDTVVNPSGQDVFQEEEKAADSLMDILGLPTQGKAANPPHNETLEFLADVKEILVKIVQVDSVLAENHITTATTASPTICIELADIEMLEASTDTVFERYDEAIEHYQDAWRFANNEINAVVCTETPDDPPPPPPPSDDQPEIDALISNVAAWRDSKDINKGLSNTLIAALQNAKLDFIAGNDTEGCQTINDFENEVATATPAKMSDAAEASLLAGNPPVLGSSKFVIAEKGCTDTPDLFGSGVSADDRKTPK